MEFLKSKPVSTDHSVLAKSDSPSKIEEEFSDDLNVEMSEKARNELQN
jgi:hypothetical protein